MEHSSLGLSLDALGERHFSASPSGIIRLATAASWSVTLVSRFNAIVLPLFMICYKHWIRLQLCKPCQAIASGLPFRVN